VIGYAGSKKNVSFVVIPILATSCCVDAVPALPPLFSTTYITAFCVPD